MTNIELPKDADGREVPLDTTTLYDESGQPLKVRVFQYSPEFGKWLVHCLFNAAEMSSRVSKCYLEPHDSWEKLEEDLDSCCASTRYIPCAYLNKSSDDCDKCLADPNKECVVQMVKHIALRIHKLRGEGE